MEKINTDCSPRTEKDIILQFFWNFQNLSRLQRPPIY